MKKSIFIKTQSKNYYIYSMNKRMLRLVNPIFSKVADFAEKGKLVKEKTIIDKIITDQNIKCSIEEGKYQISKYKYLKDNGFFSKWSNQFKNQRLTTDNVKQLFLSLPVISFEMTEACNLVCEYCGYGNMYNEFYDERSNKFLEFDKAKSVIDYYIELLNQNEEKYRKNKKITINFYGGEPLLNFKCIKKIVDYIKGKKIKNRDVEFGITTNGLLLQKYIDFIIQNDFYLFVSLDGNEYNNSYRKDFKGINHFKTVFNNLKQIKNNNPDYFHKKVNINSVLHNRNSCKEINTFIKKEFNKEAMVLELNSNNIKNKEKFDLMFRNGTESFLHYKNSIDENNDEKIRDLFINTIARYSTVYFNAIKFENYNDFFYKKVGSFLSGSCLPFYKSIFITVNNKIIFCEKIPHNKQLGIINDENGVILDFKQIAFNQNKIYDYISKLCKSCYMIHKCSSCLLTQEDLQGCEEFRNAEGMSDFFSSLLNYIECNRNKYIKQLKEITIS